MCLSIKVTSPECVLAEGVHLGYEWTVTRNRFAYRCGYVKVEKGHPWHGAGYDEGKIGATGIHGGLTFAEKDIPCDAEGPDTGWWLGFDCGHPGDAPDPSFPRYKAIFLLFKNYVVRSQDYVEAECRRLCEQAAKAAT